MAQRKSRERGPSVAEARAAAQAASVARKAANDAALRDHFATGDRGRWIVQGSVAATALFTVVSVAAAMLDTDSSRRFAAVVDLVLFGGGLVAFPVALVLGARRSRIAEMTMSGWWFLSGSAPTGVRRTLLGSLAVQCIVGLGTAAWRPYSALAFGTLVPTLGIALCGLWAARFGYFPPPVGDSERSRG